MVACGSTVVHEVLILQQLQEGGEVIGEGN